jgi:hypothetical protein
MAAAVARAAKQTDDLAAWLGKYMVGDTIPADRMTVAIQDALRESDPVKSMILFSQLMQNMTAENAQAAFATVRENVAGFDAIRYLPMLTYAWGNVDGEKAIATVREGGGREAMFGSAGVLAGWASKDPEAAKAWLTANASEGPENGFMVRSLVTGLARSNPEEAMKYINGLEGDQRNEMIGVLAEEKIKLGTAAATAWALGLTDEKMKASALDRISGQMARQDPAKAAEWVKQYASESWGKDVIGTPAREYAQRDPNAAYKWLSTIPAGPSQTEAYSQVFREWARNDATAASAALNGMSAGANRDQAVSSFTRSIARENPEDASNWVLTIADTKVRESAGIELVQRWNGTNAENAKAWASANLSPEAQAKAAENPRGDWRGGGPGGGGPSGGGPSGGGDRGPRGGFFRNR